MFYTLASGGMCIWRGRGENLCVFLCVSVCDRERSCFQVGPFLWDSRGSSLRDTKIEEAPSPKPQPLKTSPLIKVPALKRKRFACWSTNTVAGGPSRTKPPPWLDEELPCKIPPYHLKEETKKFIFILKKLKTVKWSVAHPIDRHLKKNLLPKSNWKQQYNWQKHPDASWKCQMFPKHVLRYYQWLSLVHWLNSSFAPTYQEITDWPIVMSQSPLSKVIDGCHH